MTAEPIPDPEDVIVVRTDGKPKTGEIQRLAFRHFPAAYADASAGGTVPAEARQLGYALRRLTGLGDPLDIDYVATSPPGAALLDKYIERVNPDAAAWDIVRAPTATSSSPTGRRCRSARSPCVAICSASTGRSTPISLMDAASSTFPRFGPTDDFGSALYIEKAGFNPLLTANGLPRRYDLALLSSQGFSVDAARLLLAGSSTSTTSPGSSPTTSTPPASASPPRSSARCPT